MSGVALSHEIQTDVAELNSVPSCEHDDFNGEEAPSGLSKKPVLSLVLRAAFFFGAVKQTQRGSTPSHHAACAFAASALDDHFISKKKAVQKNLDFFE